MGQGWGRVGAESTSNEGVCGESESGGSGRQLERGLRRGPQPPGAAPLLRRSKKEGHMPEGRRAPELARSRATRWEEPQALLRTVTEDIEFWLVCPIAVPGDAARERRCGAARKGWHV